MRRVWAIAALALALVGTTAPAQAAGANGWTRVSQGAVGLVAVPGLARTGDGVLHVAYVTDVGTGNSAQQATLTRAGALGGTATIAASWTRIDDDPRLVVAGGLLHAVLGGQQTGTDTGRLYDTASATGLSWTPAVAVDDSDASAGTAAAVLPDGRLLTARAGSGGIALRAGATTSTLATPGHAANASLVVAGGAVYVAYTVLDTAPGIYVRQVDPTGLAAVGPALLAPGSAAGNAIVFTAESTPLVAQPDGSVWTAYCLGYPTCHATAVWRVGSATPLTLPSAADRPHVALSTTADGRLWVAWNRTRTTLSAARSNAAGTTFGAVRTVPLPYDAVYALAADGRLGPLDAVVNAGQGIFGRRIEPGLSLKAKPKHWKLTRPAKVKVKVTDAGAPVKHAKVKAKGKGVKARCTTHRKGTCTLHLRASAKKGKVVLTAKKHAYAAATGRLKRK
jgi:hypothetical protein